MEEIVGDQVEVMEKLNASDYQIQRIEYGDAWAAGNSLGRGIEDAVGGLFNFDLGAAENYGADSPFALDDISNNAALTGGQYRSHRLCSNGDYGGTRVSPGYCGTGRH